MGPTGPIEGSFLGITNQQVTFNVALNFGDFPFDEQNLVMNMRGLWDQNVPLILNSLDLNVRESPGWKVLSISSYAELQLGLEQFRFNEEYFNYEFFSESEDAWWYHAQVIELRFLSIKDVYFTLIHNQMFIMCI